MEIRRPLIATGQQIGAGWTPALSVVKALAALAFARRAGGGAVFWLADEDHDRVEVATTVGFDGERILRHRFSFQAEDGTAAGWLPWGEVQQRAGEALWGGLPAPLEPTLRGHFLALGAPLWKRGIVPFSPTDPERRNAVQERLESWRALPLERLLAAEAARLEAAGETLVLDPRTQSAWFSLDPGTGRRERIEEGVPCPKGRWLSPGAALRPLLQSLMLPVTHVVLGPAERAYWRLADPLWDLVGLPRPTLLARPSLFVVPRGLALAPSMLPALRSGDWESFAQAPLALPSRSLEESRPDPAWGPEIAQGYLQTLAWTRSKLRRLDRRLHRASAQCVLGGDPERLRQRLFPLGKPQERVLPGILWLRDEPLLERMLEALTTSQDLLCVEES
ncbi:MAG TPA: bacillithiol biosynthesis BshC [Holophaga sp.]|nr:bacillithiol biosynthesis BshC [Holophaga sp.]HPS66994.1 bacillithiol biosynthesis BshC [Holophaga sp.]